MLARIVKLQIQLDAYKYLCVCLQTHWSHSKLQEISKTKAYWMSLSSQLKPQAVAIPRCQAGTSVAMVRFSHRMKKPKCWGMQDGSAEAQAVVHLAPQG